VRGIDGWINERMNDGNESGARDTTRSLGLVDWEKVPKGFVVFQSIVTEGIWMGGGSKSRSKGFMNSK